MRIPHGNGAAAPWARIDAAGSSRHTRTGAESRGRSASIRGVALEKTPASFSGCQKLAGVFSSATHYTVCNCRKDAKKYLRLILRGPKSSGGFLKRGGFLKGNSPDSEIFARAGEHEDAPFREMRRRRNGRCKKKCAEGAY